MIGNSSGEPGEEERGAKEEAREPNDMEEMKEQIVDQETLIRRPHLN